METARLFETAALVQNHIDTLPLDSVADTHAAQVAAFKMTHGSATVQAETATVIQNELDYFGDVYKEQVVQFLSSSHEEGPPSNLYQKNPEYEFTDDDYYGTRDPKGTYEDIAPAPYVATGEHLRHWCETAMQTDPAAVEAVWLNLLASIDNNFDFEQFRLARPGSVYSGSSNGQAGGFMAQETADLAGSIAHDLVAFTTDADTLVRYAQSPLFEEYARVEARLELELAIAERRSLDDPANTPAFYEDAVDLLQLGLDNPHPQLSTLEPAIGYIAEHVPSALQELASEHPERAESIYKFAGSVLLKLTKGEPTPQHFDQAEALAREIGTLQAYASFMKVVDGTSVTKARLSHLQELLERHPQADGMEARDALLQHLPDNQVLPFIERHLDAIVRLNRGAALKRLLNLGRADKAREFVATYEAHHPDADAHSGSIALANLALYEHTGELVDLRKAQASMANADVAEMTYEDTLYNFNLRTYLAAKKFGHTDEENKALPAMERAHNSTGGSLRISSLPKAIRAHIAMGDIAAAEQYATHLSVDDHALLDSRNLVPDQLLAVVEGYIRTGQPAEAERVISSELMRKKPYPKQALAALASTHQTVAIAH